VMMITMFERLDNWVPVEIVGFVVVVDVEKVCRCLYCTHDIRSWMGTLTDLSTSIVY